MEIERELCELANLLIEFEKYEFLGHVLKDLKSVQKIGLRALAPIKNYGDLIVYLAKLNESLDTIQVFDLAFNLEYLNKKLETTIVKIDDRLKCISVSVSKKKPLKLCYGDKCLTDAKSHKIDDLYYLRTCSTHHYCRDCIKSHIISSLYKHGINKIFCEACKKIGTKQETLSFKDILRYLTQTEIEIYFKHKKQSQYLFKCVIPKCHYKGKLLRKDFIVEFECCGNVCFHCYAKSTLNYIQSFRDIENEKDCQSISGIMCPNNHKRSAEDYSPEKVREILAPLKDLKNKDEVVKTYCNLRPYFKIKLEDYCKNCNYPNLIVSILSTCRRCKKCVKCDNFYHSLSECELVKNLKKDYPKEENLKFDKLTPEKADFQNYTTCVRLLKDMNIKNLKITSFIKLKLSERQEFYRRQLNKFFKPERKLIISDAISDLQGARLFIRSEPKLINSDIQFHQWVKREPANFDHSVFFFTIFECLYEVKLEGGQQISKGDKYKLVFYDDSLLFNNIHMMYPVYIIQASKKSNI